MIDKNNVSLMVLMAASLVVPAQVATAQDNAPTVSGFDEIIVTAQKRSQSVQDIALAVTALSGDLLAKRGQTSIESIAQSVPNLNVGEQIGQARISLRGIGVDNIAAGAEGGVAFNQDGVFYSRSAAALANFYDVDRIEVLRGPQGTLYGRNATGGSINIITARPQSEFGGYVRASTGNYGRYDFEGAVTGAVSENLAVRLSGKTQHHSGYGTNLVTGSDIDDRDSQAIRAQALLEPSDKLSILVSADYFQSDDSSNTYHYFGPGGISAAGAPVVPTGLLLGGYSAPDERDVASARDPAAESKFSGGRIDIVYDVNEYVSVHSLTAIRNSDYSLGTDIALSSLDLFPIFLEEESDQFSQEFQLNINTDKHKFVAGAYYMSEEISGAIFGPTNLILVGGPDLLTQGFYAGGDLSTDAYAIYGQDTYSVTDKFRLTVGARYSWEHKAVADQFDFDLVRPLAPSNTPRGPVNIDEKDFESFTPKIGIEYDLGEETLLYASFSKGFKSGTFNLGNTQPPLNPEKIDSYEGGVKTTLFDNRLRANVTGFYYDYTDLQVGKVRNVQLILENAATAKIYGLEGEFTLKPIEDTPLTLSLNAAWLHARFKEYVTADQVRPLGDGVTIDPDSGLPAFDLKGKNLPQAPNYVINLGAEYIIKTEGMDITLRGESFWSDRVYFSPFNRDEVSQPAYNLLNASVDFTPSSGNYSVTFFARNLANKTIRSSGQVATTLLGAPIVGFVQPPRTYGVTLGYKF